MGFREFSGSLDGEGGGYVLFEGKLDEEEVKPSKTPPQYLPENQPDYVPPLEPGTVTRWETQGMDPRDLRQRQEYKDTLSAAQQAQLMQYPQTPMRRGSTGAALRGYDKALMGDSSQAYEEGLARNAQTQGMDPRDLRLEREAQVRPKYTETVTTSDSFGNPVYVDVERTGAPLIRTNEADRPEPSFASISTDLVNQVADFPRSVEDFVEAAYAKAIGDEKRLKGVQARFGQRESVRERDTPKFSGEFLDAVYSGVQSAAQQAPGMAASILTGGVAPGLIYAALSQGMPVYNQSLEKGATGFDAAVNAVGQGAMEALFELPSMKILVDKFGKAPIRQWLGGLLAREVPLEMATTISQGATDIATRNSLDPSSERAKQEWQGWFAQLPEALGKTAIATVTQVALMGAGSAGVSAARSAGQPPAQDVAASTAINKAQNFFNPEGFGQPTAPALKGAGELTFRAAARESQVRAAEAAALLDPNTTADQAIEVAAQALARGHDASIGLAEAEKVMATAAPVVPMQLPQPTTPVIDESMFTSAVPEATAVVPEETQETPVVRNFRYVAVSKRTDEELERSLAEVKSETARKGIEEEAARRGLDFSQKLTGLVQPSATPSVKFTEPVASQEVTTTPVAVNETPKVETQPEPISAAVTLERRALHYERLAAKAELEGDTEKEAEYREEAESLRFKARNARRGKVVVEPTVTDTRDVDAEIQLEDDADIERAKEAVRVAFGETANDGIVFARLSEEPPDNALGYMGRGEQGYYKDGKRVVLIGNIRPIKHNGKTIISAEDNVVNTAFHETFHYAHDAYSTRRGEKRDSFGYTSSLRLAEANPTVAKIARQIKDWNDGMARKENPEAADALDAAERQLLAAKTPEQRAKLKEKVTALRELAGVMPKGIAVEEAMMKIGEAVTSGNYKELELRFNTKFDAPAKSSLGRVWNQFVVALRKVMRGLGLNIKVSDQEAIAILNSWKKSMMEDLADPEGVWTGKYKGKKLSSRADRATDVLWGEDEKAEKGNRKVDELMAETRPSKGRMSVEDFDRMAEPTDMDERLPMNVDLAIAKAEEVEEIEAAPPPGWDKADGGGESVRPKQWVPSEGLEERYAIGYANPGNAKLRIREGEITKLTFVTAADARKMGATEDEYGHLKLPDGAKKADLAAVLPKEFNKELVDFWKKMRKVKGAFRYGLPKQGKEFFSDLLAKDDYSVINKLADKMGITEQYKVDVTHESPAQRNKYKSTPNYTRVLFIKLTDKNDSAKKATGSLKFYREDAHGHVRLNEMSWGKDLGGGPFFVANTGTFQAQSGIGTTWYTLVSEFADRVRVPVVGDYMLSNINVYRRTEHMLSSAVRSGTTRNFIPSRKQDIYGWVARPLTPKQEAENMARLIVASARNTQQAIAGLENLSYDPETDKFTHEDGSDAEQFVTDRLKLRYSRMASIGRTTVARTVLSQMVLDGRIKPSQVKRFVKPILYSRAEVADEAGPLWRSELRDQVEAIDAKAMKPGDWITRIKNLKGVKKDEIFWSGVEEWLKLHGDQRVSKEGVLSFLDSDGVKLEESLYKGSSSVTTSPETVTQKDIGDQLSDIQKAAVEEFRDRMVESDLAPDPTDVEEMRWAYANPTMVPPSKKRKGRYTLQNVMMSIDMINSEIGLLESEGPGFREVGLASVSKSDKRSKRQGDAHQKLIDKYNNEARELYAVVERNLPPDIASAISEIAAAEKSEPRHVLSGYGFSNPYDYIPVANELSGRWKKAKFERSELVTPGGKNYMELLLKLPVDKATKRKKEINEELRRISRTPSTRGFDAARSELRERLIEERDSLVPQSETYTGSHWGDEQNVVVHIRFNMRYDNNGKLVLFIEEIQSDWSEQGRDQGFKDRGTEKEIEEAEHDFYDARAHLYNELEKVGNLGYDNAYDAARNIEAQARYETGEWSATHGEVKAKAIERVLKRDYDDVPDKLIAAHKKFISAQAHMYELKRRGGLLPAAPYVSKQEFAVFKDGEEVKRKDKDGVERQVRYGSMQEAEDAAAKVGGEAKYLGFGDNTVAWTTLAIKRAIKWAADNGVDAIAWTTGEQQARRYKKMIDVFDISWEPYFDEDGNAIEGYKNIVADGGPSGVIQLVANEKGIVQDDPDAVYHGLANQPLHRIFGKELAGEMLNTNKGRTDRDIKIGGLGLKEYYDTIIPNVVGDVLKKIGGGKVRTFNIPVGEGNVTDVETAERLKEVEDFTDEDVYGQQRGFDITPTMKAEAKKGMTLFSRSLTNLGNPINSWAIPDETKFRKAQRFMQDSMVRLKIIQDAIAGQGGTVNDGTNVYKAEERSHGRIQVSIERLKDQFMRPLAKKLADTGLSFDELAVFAYAKFAKQRNDRIRSIRPGMENGSGMFDDEADMILDTARQAGLYDELEDAHKDLMALTAATRRIQLEEGLISQATYDAWESLYPDYIPLRGFENVDDEGAPIKGGGRGINVRGEESLRALGRRTKAANLIENAIMDYERAIVRAERNNVAKHLFALAQANPDPNLWEIDPERVSVTFDKTRDLVMERRVPDKGEHTVSMKLNGDVVYMKINDDLLLRALRKTFVDETGDFQYKLADNVGWYNDMIRNTLTRYNPVFMVTNSFRDAQMGAMSVVDTLGSAAVSKYMKHYLAASKTAYLAARGELDRTSNNYYHQMYEEFQESGSTTGGFFMRDAKEVTDELRAMLVDFGGTLNNPRTGVAAAVDNAYLKARGTMAGKLAAKTVELVEHFGEASENMSRFAAYVTAREMGKSAAEAASIAKNATVNFNKKGEFGTGMNALYLFYNASMQGGARVLQALKNKEVQAIVTGMVATSLGIALLNATLGGEDDDGEKYWDKIPAYEKERNLIIMNPFSEKKGDYIKIPAPYGFSVFMALGYALADAGRFAIDPKQGRSYIKAGSDIVSAIFGSFNPVAGAFDPTDWKAWMMAASPTITDLPIQINEEINSFGNRTAPAKIGFYPLPDSERVLLSDAGTVQHRLARWINEATGGNKRQSGAVDITPSTITAVTRAATGGVGQFFLDVFNTAAQTADPVEDLNPRNIPFMNRVYGVVDEKNVSAKFYENVDAIANEHKQLMNAMRLGIKVEMDPENKALIRIGGHMDAVAKAMSGFREMELRIIEDEKLTSAEKKVKRKEVQAKRERLMNKFNQAFREAWLNR